MDMDIMKRKVIIYGMKNDIRNCLLTTNQMKLVAPSDYTGYQLAFKLLCQIEGIFISSFDLAKS